MPAPSPVRHAVHAALRAHRNVRTLECGHNQPVKPGNGTAWCPICGDLMVVAS